MEVYREENGAAKSRTPWAKKESEKNKRSNLIIILKEPYNSIEHSHQHFSEHYYLE